MHSRNYKIVKLEMKARLRSEVKPGLEQALHLQMLNGKARDETRTASFIWGFDCNVTNYNFRKTLGCLKDMVLPEG